MRPTVWFLLAPIAATAYAADQVPMLSGDSHGGPATLSDGALAPEIVPDPEHPGEKVLRLPYDFTTDVPRASWDFPVQLDLARCGRFLAEVAIDNPAAATGLTIYFQSDPGWIGMWFGPRAPAAGRTWREFDWNRSGMSSEDFGKWGSVTAIRVSLWKAAPAKGAILLRRIVGFADTVVVISPESLEKSGNAEAQTARQCVARAVELLHSAGVSCGQVADTEIARGALEGAKVAILPLNPELPEGSLEALDRFVAGGGALLVFYSAPAEVLRALGVGATRYVRPEQDSGELHQVILEPTGVAGAPASFAQDSWNAMIPEDLSAGTVIAARWADRAGKLGEAALAISAHGAYFGHILTDADSEAKGLFLRALVARYLPSVWEESFAASRAAATRLEPYESAADLDRVVRGSGSAEATARLEVGLGLVREADGVAKAGRYAEACDLAAKARKPLLEAYALAQKSRQPEFRAVWCHSPYGIAGLSWEQAIDQLADFGFNAIVPNMLWAGVTHYPSKVLPTYAGLPEKGDQIAQCLAAAKRRGVQVHVWKVNWNLENGDVPKEFLAELRAQGRTQKAPDGSDINWLCPSDDRNFALERDSMLEIARNYAVDGLHFDYIRYPDSRGCYCDGCRQRFEASVGHKVENWPADVQARGTGVRQAWLDFRCKQISRLVEAVATEARKIRPGIRISAAVFPNYPSTKEEIGQDWKLWIDRGWLDFVCPMDYTADSEDFASYVTRQREVVGGRIPLYPGIGAFIQSPDQLIHQVAIARELAPGGFIIFNYDPALAAEHLPLLRMGATAP